MVKLCSLGEILSFDDLLKKLTSLEERLAGASCCGPEASPERLSDPGTECRAADLESPVREISSPVQQDKGWDDFLAFVATKSKSAHSILKDWQLLKFTGNRLEIESGNESFSSRYFDDPDRYDQLIDYCREFFQKDMQLKLSSRPQAPGPLKRQSKEKIFKRQATQGSGLSKTAQDVLNLFDGQIMEKNMRPDKTDKKGGNTDERNA